MTLYLYVVPFLRYSASKNGVSLKLHGGIAVVQGFENADRIRLSIGRTL